MIKSIVITALLLLPTLTMAAPEVKVAITAEKEVVLTENGKDVKKRVKATSTSPGEIVFYTLHFENSGDEAAKNVDLVDPIPEGMTYINGSVFGPGSEITFSIDQGKTYKKASLLTYQVNGEKRIASPDAYSHIRWLVKKLDAGKSGTAGFQVRVK